jgi:pSer/pThr/pTyr-binding forkhead associated (FHA) protein
MAVLTVFDDGTVDGETIRIRGDRFVIGREAGDLLITHDPAVSPTHAVITRKPGDGRGVWEVTDAGSDTGLYIRVSRAKLTDGKEFLIGRGRYRFEAARGPEVVEVAPAGNGIRLPLTGPEHWIGTDPGCDLWRPDDPFAERRHARIARDPDGAWAVAHNKTVNGLWLRMTEITVNGTCFFQIGEQRFKLKAPV